MIDVSNRWLAVVVFVAGCASSPRPAPAARAAPAPRPAPQPPPKPAASAGLAPAALEWFDEDLLYIIPYGPAVGDEFDLVDDQGYVGRVAVTAVERADLSCPAMDVAKAMTRPVTALARESSADFVAIGPTRETYPKARVLAAIGDVMRAALPEEPAELYQRVVVDLDGDGAADALRDAYACPADRANGIYCYDEWHHDNAGWSRSSTSRFSPCQ